MIKIKLIRNLLDFLNALVTDCENESVYLIDTPQLYRSIKRLKEEVGLKCYRSKEAKYAHKREFSVQFTEEEYWAFERLVFLLNLDEECFRLYRQIYNIMTPALEHHILGLKYEMYNRQMLDEREPLALENNQKLLN
jgi:hypothetical protein